MVCDSIYGSFVQAMFNPVAQGEFGGEIKKVVQYKRYIKHKAKVLWKINPMDLNQGSLLGFAADDIKY